MNLVYCLLGTDVGDIFHKSHGKGSLCDGHWFNDIDTRLEHTFYNVRTVFEDRDGYLYFGTRRKEVVRLR